MFFSALASTENYFEMSHRISSCWTQKLTKFHSKSVVLTLIWSLNTWKEFFCGFALFTQWKRRERRKNRGNVRRRDIGVLSIDNIAKITSNSWTKVQKKSQERNGRWPNGWRVHNGQRRRGRVSGRPSDCNLFRPRFEQPTERMRGTEV